MKALLLSLPIISALSQAIPDDSSVIEFYSNSEWRCSGNVWQVKIQDLWMPWYNESGEPIRCEEVANNESND